MLQAISKEGNLVTPALYSKNQIATIRGQIFYCPSCKEKVHLRAGEVIIPHFSHYKTSSCHQGGGESDYHQQGKLQLYDWLQKQYSSVKLEHYLPDIHQWPDLLLQVNNKQIALEFQCAKISTNEIIQRNEGYKRLNIQPIWIIGASRFKRIGKNKLRIDTFTTQLLQCYSPALPIQLLYYCPYQKCFLLVSDLHQINSHQAIAQFTFRKADSITFPELFRPPLLSSFQLYKAWSQEKRVFRLSYRKVRGKEKTFRKWLYQHYLHIENLPGIIHLPNPSQHIMNCPLWHWQSRFVIGFLDRLSIGVSFDMRDVQVFFGPFYREGYLNRFRLCKDPGQTYIQQLIQLGILEFRPDGKIIKKRAIRFYQHIDEAMKGDQAVLERLMEQ